MEKFYITIQGKKVRFHTIKLGQNVADNINLNKVATFIQCFHTAISRWDKERILTIDPYTYDQEAGSYERGLYLKHLYQIYSDSLNDSEKAIFTAELKARRYGLGVHGIIDSWYRRYPWVKNALSTNTIVKHWGS